MLIEKQNCSVRLVSTFFVTLALALFIAFHNVALAEVSSATLDITSISESSGILTLNIKASENSKGLDAFAFNLTFAADRLEYQATGAVANLACSASVNHAVYMIGCYATGTAQKTITIPVTFKVKAVGPYVFAVDKNTLKDDLKGALVSRPGFFAGTYDFKAPRLWSVASADANLFWVIPDVRKVTGIALQYNGVDILFPILELSSWYYDEIQDVAWLVMPALDLPAGFYPVASMISYTDRADSYILADVAVLQ